MIDIHTHILPHMDDGSSSREETIAMLDAMHGQGVTKVIATPHFYADNEDPEEFFVRRKKAYKEIEGAHPKVIVSVGAEVHYYGGCGATKELDRMKIEGTDFLLLELPDRHFNPGIPDDLMMMRERGIRPIIAHLNRYKVFHDNDFIDFCNAEGILIQLNTECIMSFMQRRRSIDLMTSGRADFLATDCHDTMYRKPNKKEALDIIAKTAGSGFVQEFLEREEYIIDVTS